MRMFRRTGALVPAAALVVLAACVPRAPNAHAALPSRDVLTAEELKQHPFTTVLEALQSLRPNWLQAHGTDSFYTPSEVRVYLDSNELGGPDALNLVQLASVVYIQHYDGVAATARWGVGHSMGVIYISTHPANGPI